jgi:ADP-ribosyl-[dinitrogen reductase] hydrolase
MQKDKAAGALLGLACGDALGRPVEFQSAESIEREHGQVTEMLGGGAHNKPPGTITDDTELALCIAYSLLDCEKFDPADVTQRFVAWYDSNPFDIGLMTADTLRRLKDGGDWEHVRQEVWKSRPEGQNAGNGSIMRCAPYALAFANQPDRLREISRTSSSITHADPRCTYGCAVLNQTLAGLLTSEPDPLETALERLDSDAPDELVTALRGVPAEIDPETLQSSGYVIHTLQTGLYHGLTARNPRDGIVSAVNMGRDTDTVGAVTGALVGARFGAEELPDRWGQALTLDDTGRNTPAWWPDPQSVPATTRDLAHGLTDGY